MFVASRAVFEVETAGVFLDAEVVVATWRHVHAPVAHEAF